MFSVGLKKNRVFGKEQFNNFLLEPRLLSLYFYAMKEDATFVVRM